MSAGAHTNYTTATKISELYREYPVAAWRKLFNDVYDALTKSKEEDTEESTKSEETTFNTTVVNNGH
jgi:hypothetical protein